MKLTAFEAVAGALRDANVRYLVATGDVDLVIQLKPDNVMPAFRALAGLGYHPIVPVTAEQFADEKQRRQWTNEKGMTVLSLYSDRHPISNVDVFVTEPFDFDSEYDRALVGELSPDLFVRFVSIPTLIAMKRIANRPRDLDDIEHLEIILNEERRSGSDT